MLRRVRSAKLVDRPLEFRTLAHGGVATQAFVITNHIRRLKVNDLTNEQVDAIIHAWLDLKLDTIELAVACKDSVQELEDAFPFLLEKDQGAS